MRTKSRTDPILALWQLYDRSANDDKPLIGAELVEKCDQERELKDMLTFVAKSSSIDIMSVCAEVWCSKHQAKLETYGLAEVWRMVKQKCLALQVIVLAYWIQGVGRQALFQSPDFARIFNKAPMREIGAKLDKMGWTYLEEVIEPAKPVPQIDAPRKLWRIR